MKKILMAAIAALSLSALADPAFARDEGWGRDRGGSQSNNGDQNNRGDGRGDDNGRRGDNRGGNDDGGRRGGNGGQRWQGNSGPQNPATGLAGGPGNGGGRRGDVHALGNPQRDWSNNNGPRNGGPRNDGPRNDGPHNNAGPRDDNNAPRNWSNNGGPDCDGPNRNWQNNGRPRADDRNRDDRGRDWNNDRGRDNNRYGDNHRDDRWDNARDRGGRRSFNESRRYAYGGRDYRGPRYDDWRGVRPGRYFNDYYARNARSYFGHPYFWWDYPNWRRPYRPYRVGYILPAYVYWDDLPYDYYGYMPPPPYGCRYVAVDRDVLLIVVASGLILDALIYDGDWRGRY
jgi:hypothetical protein